MFSHTIFPSLILDYSSDKIPLCNANSAWVSPSSLPLQSRLLKPKLNPSATPTDRPLPQLLSRDTDPEYVTALWNEVRVFCCSFSDVGPCDTEMAGDQGPLHSLQQYGIDILNGDDRECVFQQTQGGPHDNTEGLGNSGIEVWQGTEGNSNHFENLADKAKLFTHPHTDFIEFYNFIVTNILQMPPSFFMDRVSRYTWAPWLFEVFGKDWESPPMQQPTKVASNALAFLLTLTEEGSSAAEQTLTKPRNQRLSKLRSGTERSGSLQSGPSTTRTTTSQKTSLHAKVMHSSSAVPEWDSTTLSSVSNELSRGRFPISIWHFGLMSRLSLATQSNLTPKSSLPTLTLSKIPEQHHRTLASFSMICSIIPCRPRLRRNNALYKSSLLTDPEHSTTASCLRSAHGQRRLGMAGNTNPINFLICSTSVS